MVLQDIYLKSSNYSKLVISLLKVQRSEFEGNKRARFFLNLLSKPDLMTSVTPKHEAHYYSVL